MNTSIIVLKHQVSRWLWFFIVSLVLSGLTAFPVETELKWLLGIWQNGEGIIYEWLQKVYEAVKDTNKSTHS
jgi:hypothetical protein